MIKLRLNPLLSDLFIAIYLLTTLGIRFYLEPQLQQHPAASIGVGVFALFFLWALVKGGFLNPNYFGLFSYHQKKISGK